MRELLSWTADKDSVIIPRLLALHAPNRDPLRIVDVCANRGYMWQGTGYTPLRCDIDPAQRPDVVADCRALPFVAGSVDVLVFDPPHVPGVERHMGMQGGRDWSGKYGTGTAIAPDGVSTLCVQFLVEAARVLGKGGIILAKLADGVFQGQMRWHHADFISAVGGMPGLTACDMQVKIRAQSMPTPDWQVNQFHHRAAHSYWIVVRKGGCQGHGIPRPARAQQPALWAEEVLA